MNSREFTYISVAICLMTLLAYWNVIGAEFIAFDDPSFIHKNRVVNKGLSLESITQILTSTKDGNWFPLTWISHALDVSMFGFDPLGHHAVNLFLHLVNSVLLLILLTKMTGYKWRSAFVSILFALHPMHVESVAWVASRKDVLSGFFFMLMLLAYHSYTCRRSTKSYLLVVVLFAMGLCSKPMLVTVPVLLLLLDYWPLARHSTGEYGTVTASARFLIYEKIPLFAFAVISSVITYISQDGAGGVLTYGQSSLSNNISNAVVSYVNYIQKMLYPSDLAVLYPFESSILLHNLIAAALLLLVISFIAIVNRKNRPYIFTGWFWFIVSLIPVIGVIRLGAQSMADRYTYLPFVGLFIIIVWLVGECAKKGEQFRKYIAVAASVIVAVLMLLTWKQVSYWKNTKTLFTHAVEVTSNNFVAHDILGLEYKNSGDLNRALFHLNESLRINPVYVPALLNIAITYSNLGNYDAAFGYYIKVLNINPKMEMAYLNMGLISLLKGDVASAFNNYESLKSLNSEMANSLMQSINQVSGYKNRF